MHKFTIQTPTRNTLIKINDEVQNTVKEMNMEDGVITVYSPHTTAGICINESDDPAVQRDILKRLNDLVPLDLKYDHQEGNSDAHIKSTLTGNSVQVFVEDGKIQLGTWQVIYFCEFDGPREREVWIK